MLIIRLQGLVLILSLVIPLRSQYPSFSLSFLVFHVAALAPIKAVVDQHEHLIRLPAHQPATFTYIDERNSYE